MSDTGDKLHAAIMNLPDQINPEADRNDLWIRGYNFGHRDARHAAAELVCAAWSARDSEVERLREDAERYRWLRECVNRAGGPVVAMEGGSCPGQRELFDAAIDAALLSSQDKESA